MPLPGEPGWVYAPPTYDEVAQRKPKRNLLAAGLSSGIDDVQGLFGSAAQGAGRLLGLPSLETAGRDIAIRNQQQSAENGRPDLEIAPWKEDGADVLPWLGYQATKQVPIIATYILGGKAYGRMGGQAPAAAERLGAVLPRALGGGGARAGADWAVRRESIKRGKDFGTALTGGAIAGMPIGFGAMVQEADQQPGGLTVKDAAKAALLSPVYSALDAIQPAGLTNLFKRGQAGNIVRRVATAAFAGGAAEVPQEGLQTALEMSFRPDLSLKERFSNIVDAAVTGGAVGGVFGGFGGVRAAKRVDPMSMTDTDIASVVDEVLGLPSPQSVAARAPASNEEIAVDPAGVGSARINPVDYQQSEFDVGGAPRPYENVSPEELQAGLGAAKKAIENNTASDDVLRFVEEANRELATRNGISTINAVGDETSRGGAAQSGPTTGDGGAVSAAPAPVNTQQTWDAERDTLLKGIATRKWYREATSPDELDAILRARLENGSTAKSDMELAKRRGIDVNAPSAPVAATAASTTDPAQQTPLVTQAAPAPAAPANQGGGDFAARWKADVQKTGKKDKSVRAIKPADEADAQRKLYEALGQEGEVGDGLERLAQQYGILDAEKRLTPLAVEIATKEPISTEEAVKAGRAQGFKGAKASEFDRGVRAYLAGQAPADSDAAAAGAQWAAERNSVPRGALKKYEPKRYTGDVTDEQVAAMGRQAQPAQPRVVPPEVSRLQTVNRAIDATRAGFATPDDDVAQLKRMVREGDVEGAMAGLSRVQAGEKLFVEPDRKPVDFKGESVVRGAPRGQVTATLVPTRAASRAEAERAIRKFEVGRAIDAAFAEGAIDGKERIKLVGKLNRGRVKEVAAAVPVVPVESLRSAEVTRLVAERRARLSDLQEALDEAVAQAAVEAEVSELSVDERGVLRNDQVKIARRDFLAGVAAAAAVGLPTQSRAALADKPVTKELRVIVESSTNVDPVRILDYLRRNSQDAGNRMIAAKLLRGDWSHVGVQRGTPSDSVAATTFLNDDGSTTVMLYGEDGMTEQTILHELIHAFVQQRWGGLSAYTPRKKARLGDTTDRGDATLERFVKIWDQVGEVLKAKGLTSTETWAAAAYSNPDEMLSWVLTNPDAQAFLKSIDSTGEAIKTPKPKSQMSIWDKIVEFFAELFGSNTKPMRAALDDVLSAGYAVLDVGAGVRAGDFNVKLARDMVRRRLEMPMAKGPPSTVAQINTRAQEIVGQVNSVVDRLPSTKSFTGRALKLLTGWMPMTHITEHYKRIFPEVGLLQEAHAARRATTAVFAHLYNAPKLLSERMSQTKEGKSALDTTSELMELTAWDIDYAKTWADNDHLHGAENEDVLKRLHADGHRKYNALKGSGQNVLIDQYRQINEMEHYASMALAIRQLVSGEPTISDGITGFDTDPVEVFRNNSALHNPVEARKYWRDILHAQITEVEDQITALRGTLSAAANARLSPVERYVKEVKKGIQSMDQAPYFHLGRQGEHTVFGSVRLGADKKVDPAAVDHVARELEKAGVTDARISRDLDKPQIFLRVETPERRDAITAVMMRLQREGWLNRDIEVTRGVREQGEYLPERTRQEMNRFIEALRADPMFEVNDSMSDTEKESIQRLRDSATRTAYDVWLDLLPDTATSKVLTHRESKPGFSTNMARSFAFRYNIAVNSIASLSAEPQLNEAFEKMRGRLNEAKVAEQGQDIDTISTVYAELTRREAERPMASKVDGYDTWRAWTHAFYLGLSPSYVLINMTQIGALLWPELSKQHGFVKTGKALAKVTPLAFQILRATMSQGWDAGGLLRAADGVITQEALQKALGTDRETTEFMMNMIGSGIIDIGSAARELATVAEGREDSTQGKMLRFAASAGLYSETFTRLVAALSARELHRGTKEQALEYSKNVVRESMLEYSTWNVARNMGKMGVAGPFTPVMMSFLQYSTQVTWKLYREFSTALLDRAATDTEKAAAKKFLLSHLTAVTVLAGTLGLPFATVAAHVLEKLVDLFDDDDEPFDATASWRDWLHETFGDTIGDMMARGVSRGGGYGFDLSTRAGEQNLLPFSQWLTDKRKFRDASQEAALRSLGAPLSMAGSVAEGFEKIADGDVLGGLTMMMPSAIRGPATAYKMGQDGYTDALGNKLPMSPKATDYMVQLIGLTPHAKAEYSEARSDHAARRSILLRQAKRHRDGIIKAMEARDNPLARERIQRAMKFAEDNPAFNPLDGIEAAIEGRERLQAISQATRTPIGVRPNDIDGRALTNYADVEYRAQ